MLQASKNATVKKNVGTKESTTISTITSNAMAGLKKVDGYDEYVVNICPNDSDGEVIEIGEVLIQFPKTPKKKDIHNYDKPRDRKSVV